MDSLTLAGIELLGLTPSMFPECEGAIFALDPAFDLSSAQITSSAIAGLLLDGEQVTNFRASNRAVTLPVSIVVNSTGDSVADTLTLDSARELLLRSASQERYQLVWTRDGSGLPLTFDCMGLTTAVVNWAIEDSLSLVSQVTLTFQAFPYGRSDTEETILFNTPSQAFDTPASTVNIDQMTVATNFLTGDDAGFEVTIGNWVQAGNCAVVRTTAQHHSGVGALQMTSSAAGNMQAANAVSTAIIDQPGVTGLGIKCNPGDTITAKAWFRSAVTGRSCNVGADFYDTSGNVVGSTLRGSNITDLTTGWTQATASLTCPAGAQEARLNVQVLAPAAANEVHYVDDPYIDRGPVYSADDSDTWSVSTVTVVGGNKSALWSRRQHDAPVYDHVLSAPLDITGRAKFAFWLGLATTSGGYKQWHKGNITVAIQLTDNAGNTISFGAKHVAARASSLQMKPQWQRVSLHIPQNIPNFVYSAITEYSIQLWNVWDAYLRQPCLEASAYINTVQAAASSTGSPVTRGGWYDLPGIVGSARAPLSVQAQPGPSSFSTIATFTTPGSNSWVAPAGVTSVDRVFCLAGGGGGAGGVTEVNAGGGGGGGESAISTKVPVTAGNTYHPVVGAGGTHGSGGMSGINNATSGGDSYFIGDSSNTTYANGGNRGWIAENTWGGGKGGDGSNAPVHYPGGNGYQANVNGVPQGGGGGGSAGTSSAGNSASGRGGGSAVTGGGPGGTGGGDNVSPEAGQTPTGFGGGGGGGSDDNSGGHNGGDGQGGMIQLSYGASGILPISSLLVHMPKPDAPPELSPLCPVGNGADTPNGGTEYTVPPINSLPARFDGTYTVYLIASSYNNPTSSHTVSVVIKQYAYSSGPSVQTTLSRTFTPSTDILNGYIDLGNITLPLADMAPGNTDSFFVVTVTSNFTIDRYLDVLFLDTQGQLVFVNFSGSAFAQNVWIDEAELDRDLGRVLASETDRDRARSCLASDNSNRVSGGPLCVTPEVHNRVLVYQQQGVPATTMSYLPRWQSGRLQ